MIFKDKSFDKSVKIRGVHFDAEAWVARVFETKECHAKITDVSREEHGGREAATSRLSFEIKMTLGFVWRLISLLPTGA